MYHRHIYGEETDDETENEKITSRHFDTNSSINSENESNQWGGNDRDELKMVTINSTDDSNTILKNDEFKEEDTIVGSAVLEAGPVKDSTIGNSTIFDQNDIYRNIHETLHFIDNSTNDNQYR